MKNYTHDRLTGIHSFETDERARVDNIVGSENFFNFDHVSIK